MMYHQRPLEVMCVVPLQILDVNAPEAQVQGLSLGKGIRPRSMSVLKLNKVADHVLKVIAQGLQLIYLVIHTPTEATPTRQLLEDFAPLVELAAEAFEPGSKVVQALSHLMVNFAVLRKPRLGNQGHDLHGIAGILGC